MTKREYIKKIRSYLYFLAEEPNGKDYPELGLTKEQAKEIKEEIYFYDYEWNCYGDLDRIPKMVRTRIEKLAEKFVKETVWKRWH